MVLRVVLVVALVVVVVLVAATLLTSSRRTQREPIGPGRWRATHYDADGVTKVVVQKVSATGVNLLDEHVVAELHREGDDYDARFLEAMSTARQRQAVFEAEEE